MKIYLVFKEAVCRHECGGAYSTLKAAREAALHFLASESDDHHHYTIIETDLDVMPPTIADGCFYNGGPDESDPVTIFRRKNGAISEHEKY